MKFSWTMKELETSNDTFILRSLVSERLSGLNPYAPLAMRLKKIYEKLDKNLEAYIMRGRKRTIAKKEQRRPTPDGRRIVPEVATAG
jgi:hypothetical protein